MKNWMKFAFTWGTIALLFDSVKAEPELDGVCDVLNSFTPEGRALSRFNAVFFGDFITGKNANVMGPLAVKGTIIGENAYINSKKTTSCSPLQEDEIEHHGLILGGANASPITVNGFAYLQNNSKDPKVMTPLEACEDKETETEFNFDKAQQSAMKMSRKLAGMLPNWSIDADGVIVNMLSEGVKADQPFNLFSMPACTMGACKALNYFDCGQEEDCEAPTRMLSNVDSMFLGKGKWNGPVEEPYPNSEMVVFNIPVLNQHTFDIQSENPGIGLNACNTMYNFYAVDEEGKYNPEGHFTIKRSTTEPLGGMVLAPQAHVLDDIMGSFSGQVIAASYEAIGDNITIKDYISSGNNQCQSFQGCLTSANKSPEDEIAELEANNLEENVEAEDAKTEGAENDEASEDNAPEDKLQEDKVSENEVSVGVDEESEANVVFNNEIFEENEEPWNNIVQYAENEVSDSVNVDEVSVSDVFGSEYYSVVEDSEDDKRRYRSKKPRKARKARKAKNNKMKMHGLSA